MDRIDTATRPLDALCNDIVDRYHAPLRRRLLRLRDTVTGLAASDGNRELETAQQAFVELASRIESHLSKEEHLLFPAIVALADATPGHVHHRRSPFITLVHPIRMFEAEHTVIESDFDRLRELARTVAGPQALTPAWQRCLADLAELHAELHEHHRTENEILFPRALDAERLLL